MNILSPIVQFILAIQISYSVDLHTP